MVQFPKRAEGPCDLPDGSKVWIKTLNRTYRGYVFDAANAGGRQFSAPVRKGGSAYKALLVDVQAMSSEDQAEFVAEQPTGNGIFDRQAEEKFADPPAPDRKEKEDDAAFGARVEEYEKQLADLVSKREEEIKRLHDSLVQEVLSLSEKERVERCLNAAVNDQYTKGYVQAYTNHTIYYSTRKFDDHDEFYFGDDEDKAIRRIRDLDDEVREAILKKINEFDSLKQKEIPT